MSAAAGRSWHLIDVRNRSRDRFDNLGPLCVGSLSISTMHLAKGLDFRAVAVMACDDEVIPLQERIETATDASELEDVYNTERRLLYVACTRARDCLLLSSAGSHSEFLRDMQK
jgi:superfamily I DNA/RNA helicase